MMDFLSFSDTFSLRWEGSDNDAAESVSLLSSNIAWKTDVGSKFSNPDSE